MNIRFLGVNNTVSIESKYSCFLIDGILGVDAGSIASGLALDEQRKIEAVLLSHTHYDHIRELLPLAFNNFASGKTIKVFGTKETLDNFSTRFSGGKIYPDFVHGSKHFKKPILELHEVRPLERFEVGKYAVFPVQIPHTPSSVGYEIAIDGKGLFYTGDTGPGLRGVWEKISPDLIVTELTLPDRLLEFARESHHLTPTLLREELEEFKRQKEYVPKVLATHRNPELDREIETDVRQVFQGWNIDINLAVTCKDYPVC